MRQKNCQKRGRLRGGSEILRGSEATKEGEVPPPMVGTCQPSGGQEGRVMEPLGGRVESCDMVARGSLGKKG